MNHNNSHHGFAASVPGAGHIRYGIPCQDASAAILTPRAAAIVCDGRGSARLSHYGAQGAVKAFATQIAILEPFLEGILDNDAPEEKWQNICRLLYRTLMQVKLDLAAEHDCDEKEFDFTVAFVIAGSKNIGCFQVGDGAIVLQQNGKCQTVFLPDKGEFANQTYFLRQNGENTGRFHAALFPAAENSGFALTSDGPEHLMFRLSDMTPGKIFPELLEELQKEELCHQDLMDYLTRNVWNNDPRGSDDRSLVIMCPIQQPDAPQKLAATAAPENAIEPEEEAELAQVEDDMDSEGTSETPEIAVKPDEAELTQVENTPQVEQENNDATTGDDAKQVEITDEIVTKTDEPEIDPEDENSASQVSVIEKTVLKANKAGRSHQITVKLLLGIAVLALLAGNITIKLHARRYKNNLLITDVPTSQKQIVEIKQKMATLMQLLQEVKANYAELTADNADLHASNAELKVSNNELNDLLSLFQKELEHTGQSLANLQEQNDSLATAKDKLAAQLAAAIASSQSAQVPATPEPGTTTLADEKTINPAVEK